MGTCAVTAVVLRYVAATDGSSVGVSDVVCVVGVEVVAACAFGIPEPLAAVSVVVCGGPDVAAVSGAATWGGIFYPEHARDVVMSGSIWAVSDIGALAGPGASMRDIEV